jgi:short-subunit dehydrogenase
MEQSLKTALITGATSGIGLELARLLARDHYRLIIAARTAEELKATAAELTHLSGEEVLTMVSDLSKDNSAQELYDFVKQKSIALDVLVNNAGYAEYGLFKDIPLGKELGLIQLNLVSLTVLTKLFMDDMISRGRGRILNVASTAAFQPGPLMSVYYATKAYVLSLTEALANELQGTGVTMTALCPGPTKTNFQNKIGVKLPLFNGSMSAQTVAEIGYRGLMKGKTVVIPGWRNKLLVQSLRLAPRQLVPKIVRRIQEAR